MNDSTLSVGADVHLKDIVLRAVDQRDGRQVIEPFSVTNNLPGAQSAAATMAQTATRLGYDCIQIGYEATGMLWIPFHHFLSSTPLLEPFELQLVCFNPKLVANFKDALVLRRPKNDDRDTLDVSARVRFGEWPDSYMPSPFWRDLAPVITAGVLAEIVDVSRFPEHKASGSVLRDILGATLTRQLRLPEHPPRTSEPLTKVDNPYGRYYFIQGADKARRHAMEYKAFYWRKYNEVSKYRHKRALVLTARKLVRLVHALLTKNELYVRPRTPISAQEDRSLQ